jgi:hypothetical protein
LVLERYYLGCLAHASYLIADEASAEAAAVDPDLIGGYAAWPAAAGAAV